MIPGPGEGKTLVKFAVMTDLHAEIIHDAERRLEIFTKAVNESGCDFAIELGDFIAPGHKGAYTCSEDRVNPAMRNEFLGLGRYPGKRSELFKILEKLPCPLYHVLGNHDLDLHTKEEVMESLGMERPYYSFDVKEVHFVVLDANFVYEDGKAVEFSRGNYMKWLFQKAEPFPYLPPEELNWLSEDLQRTEFPSVVFCHEGLNGGFLNALNHEEVFDVLKAAPHGVKLCLAGHKHQDLLEEEEGIPCYYVNSISGYSVPAKFACRRFSEEIETDYPNVQYMCVYEDPLYVIVTMDESGIEIRGQSTSFVPPDPETAGVHFERKEIVLTPTASSCHLQ